MNILGRNYIKSSGKLRVVREKNKIVIENNSDIKQKLIFYKSIKTDNKRLTINSVSNINTEENCTIKILNSSRPAQAQIPELVWQDSDTRLTKEAAENLLKEAGFTDYEFQEEYSEEVEAGYVISQDPVYQDNYKINLNQKITILVSKGQ